MTVVSTVINGKLATPAAVGESFDAVAHSLAIVLIRRRSARHRRFLRLVGGVTVIVTGSVAWVCRGVNASEPDRAT
jgi:hypothetical protein